MLLKVEKLVKMYKIPILGGIAKELNYLLGVDIPRCVVIGNNVHFPHNSVGTVIHDKTVLEDNVKIYQNVTLGRSDIYKDKKHADKDFEGFHIKEGACLCAGAKLICKKGTLTVGKNAVVGANAVLLNSIGDNEIWSGVPARFIGMRDDIENI